MWAAAFYTCYLLLSGPVGSPKLFIHTEALAVPGHKVEVRAEDGMALGWPLTRLINFIPYTMLSTVYLSIVLIITLCISDEGLTASGALLKRAVAPQTVGNQMTVCDFVCLCMCWGGADGEVSLTATLMCPAELPSQERSGL